VDETPAQGRVVVPPLRRGDIVRLTIGAWSVDAFVGIASSNGRSVILLFDGAAPLDVGVVVGMLPVLLDDAGQWREIVRNTPITLTRGCQDYRPDHNGECLNCDEDADAHRPGTDDPSAKVT
jgi:hypothetical protein